MGRHFQKKTGYKLYGLKIDLAVDETNWFKDLVTQSKLLIGIMPTTIRT